MVISSNSPQSTDLTYTISYVSQMLGESESYILQLCDRLGVRTQSDAKTGRICVTPDDMELLRRMVQTEMTSQRQGSNKAYGSYNAPPKAPVHPSQPILPQQPQPTNTTLNLDNAVPVQPAYDTEIPQPTRVADGLLSGLNELARGYNNQRPVEPKVAPVAAVAPPAPQAVMPSKPLIEEPKQPVMELHSKPQLSLNQAPSKPAAQMAPKAIQPVEETVIPTAQPRVAPTSSNTAASVVSVRSNRPTSVVSEALSRGDISMVVETVTNAKESILTDLSKLLDDKLAGLDELVVELIRSKTENDALRDEIKRFEQKEDDYKSELDKYKPTAFGFFRKIK